MHARLSSATMSVTSRCAIVLACTILLSTGAASQVRLSDWLKKIPSAAISEAEAGRGVKEALTQGVTRAVLNLHKTDGFFGSDIYRMLLPPDARKAETALRRVGLGSQVDRAILAINRGAEDAVGTATPIFADAITGMTVTDALGLVRGDTDAATQYFRRKTSDHLIAAFAPSVRTSLDRTHATRYYADLASSYNRLPLSFEKVNPDLTSYVVAKAVDALFDQIAREEANIRANPVARTTEILRKVFSRESVSRAREP